MSEDTAQDQDHADTEQLNMGVMHEWARLHVMKKFHEQQLEKIKKRLSSVGATGLGAMQLYGVAKLPISLKVNEEFACTFDGRVTLSSKTRLVAGPSEGTPKEELVAWLEDHEPDIVKTTYNASTFNAYIKRAVEDNMLDPELAKLVNIHEIVSPSGTITGTVSTR